MAGRERRWKALIVAAVVGVATVPAELVRPTGPDDAVGVRISANVQPGPADVQATAEPLRAPQTAREAPRRPSATAERPSSTGVQSAGPIPVLVIPGWSDDESRLTALGARLTAAGWGDQHVLTISFADPVGSNRDHAREIAQAALALKARTGVERIDIIAHSMGGLATRYFLQNGGDVHVRRVVFLATPHMGTLTAHFGWGEGAREMEPRSAFLLGLLRAQPLPLGVRAITIRTPLDLHVVPGESAILPGVPDLTVCCPTHAGLLDDDHTFELIQRFLSDYR